MREHCRPRSSADMRRRERVLTRIMQNVGFDKFETQEDAKKRNNAMNRRLSKLDNPSKCRALTTVAMCSSVYFCDQFSKCPAACHHASRAERARVSVRFSHRIKEPNDTFIFVTIVQDKWRKEYGHLDECRPKTLLQWFVRKLELLDQPKGSIRGIVGVDVSVNEVDGKSFWQPHLHAVLTGIQRTKLRRVFNLSPTETTPKPILMKTVEPRKLAKTIGYTIKRSVEKRVAYTDENGARNQRRVKVLSEYMTEHDRWLLTQKIDERFRVIGIRLSREPLVRGVSFRPNFKYRKRRSKGPDWDEEYDEI